MSADHASPAATVKPSRTGRAIAYLLAPLVLVVVGWVFFSSTGRDDAHITYWASYALSEFGEILNYNGERVEQSSSLLQVLLFALVRGLSGIDVAALGKPLSILFGIAGVTASYLLARRIDPRAPVIAPLLAATSPFYVYWSYGGMEATLVALASTVVILAFGAFLQSPRWSLTVVAGAAGATAAFLLVRPETFLVVGCVLVGSIAISMLRRPATKGGDEGYPTGGLLVLLTAAFVLSAALFAFRVAYFGSPFPQPVLAKAGGVSAARFVEGLDYLRWSLLLSVSIGTASLLAAVAIARAAWRLVSGKANVYLLLSVLHLLAYGSFIAFAGGDWMEAGRFLVHLTPVAAAVVALGLRELVRSKIVFGAAVALLLVLQLVGNLAVARRHSTGMPVWSRFVGVEEAVDAEARNYPWFERRNRVHMRDISTLSRLRGVIRKVRSVTDEPLVIMSGQMGMLAYYTAREHFGDVRLVDRYGLADRTFTDCPVTSGTRRTSIGLGLRYQAYFDLRDAIEDSCGFAPPDLIVDRPAVAREVAAHDYTIVHLPRRRLWIDSRWFPGNVRIADSVFIAVRDDLLSAAGGVDAFAGRMDFHEGRGLRRLSALGAAEDEPAVGGLPESPPAGVQEDQPSPEPPGTRGSRRLS